MSSNLGGEQGGATGIPEAGANPDAGAIPEAGANPDTAGIPPVAEPVPAPAPPKRSLTSRTNLIRIGTVVVILAIGVGLFLFRDRLSGAAEDLVVGDCIDLPTADEFQEVQHRPCTEPHEAEVFVVANFETDASLRPASAEFEAWVQEQCLGQAFTDYTGQTYEAATEIGVGYFSPSFDGWSNGDREMTCYLAPVDGGKVSTSYKKAS